MKACINEINNTQEKDEKCWRSIEKDYLEKFVLVELCSVHSNEGGFAFFPLLLEMLIGVDKKVGFRHGIDDKEYAFSYSVLRVKHHTS